MRPRTSNGGHRKAFVPRSPTGPCSVIISPLKFVAEEKITGGTQRTRHLLEQETQNIRADWSAFGNDAWGWNDEKEKSRNHISWTKENSVMMTSGLSFQEKKTVGIRRRSPWHTWHWLHQSSDGCVGHLGLILCQSMSQFLSQQSFCSFESEKQAHFVT